MQPSFLLGLIFFLSIGVGLIFYLVGHIIGEKRKESKNKGSSYACGEELPTMKLQVDIERFLIYAVYFLIFDSLAFIIATSFSSPGIFPIIYTIVVMMAIVILLSLFRRE